MHFEVLRKIVFLRYVTYIVAHSVRRERISKHNIAIFHGIIRPSKWPISRPCVALKASQGEKRLNFVATTALSLLILWRLLCRRNRGCVRLTNERNKLCRDQLYNEERFASRACATTEELQVRFHFPHLVRITRREAKYDIEELYVNCLNFCDTKIVRSTR